MKRTGSMILYFLMAAFIAVSTYFISSSTATLAFSIAILFFGSFFTIMLSGKSDRILALKLYYIIFSLYVLLAINHFLGYQTNWSLFTQDWLDEYKFFLVAEKNQFLSVQQIFVDSFVDRKYRDYGGYTFYISLLSSIAESAFDGNHLLLQLLGTVIFGAISSVVVFKILSLYVSTRKAFNYALIFMLFSAFSFYSFKLLRDAHIAFFYTFGFYLVLSESSRGKLLNLFLVLFTNILIWELRFEHGLFFTLVTLYLCFKIFRKNKVALSLIGLIAVVLFATISLNFAGRAMTTLDRSEALTKEKISETEGSLSKYIYRLPPVAKHLGIVVYSQIQPFPSWLAFSSSENIYRSISGFLLIINAFFWFIVFFSLVRWLIFERKTTALKGELLVLSLLCLLFLLLNSAEMSPRRILATYPFIYLLYVFIRENSISKYKRKKTIVYGISLYLALVTCYLALKL